MLESLLNLFEIINNEKLVNIYQPPVIICSPIQRKSTLNILLREYTQLVGEKILKKRGEREGITCFQENIKPFREIDRD